MSTVLKSLIVLFALVLTSCSSDLSSNTPPEGLTVTWPKNGSHVKATALTMTGACKADTVITISGDITASPVTTSCSGSAFSSALTLSAGQGVKTISVIQTASDNTSSDPEVVNVTLDTSAPSAPTVVAPTVNQRLNQFSQSISGNCETGAAVRVTGNILAPPKTGNCSGGTYSVGVTFTTGQGNKNFAVAQTDRAGNASSSTSRTIIIDSVAPAAPAYTSPAGNNTSVNSVSQTIAGTCEAFAIVLISGAIQNAPVEATCSSGGSFSRAINLVPGNGSKSTALVQRDQAGNYSTAIGRTIILNTVNPAAAKTFLLAAGSTYTSRNIRMIGSVTQRESATNNSPAVARNITMTIPAGVSGKLSRNTAYVGGKNNEVDLLQSKADLNTVYYNLAQTVKKINSTCLDKALSESEGSHMSDTLI